MRIEPTPLSGPGLSGVLLLTPRRHGDARGFFCETWNRRTLEEAGLHLPAFVQDNQSLSARAGTLRGLHYQAPPHAQGKLVRCGRGRLWDVAVDIRRGSPSFGQHFGTELSAENGCQLWIPPGFLHGFLTLTDACEILYKCTAFYAPAADGAVRWDSAGIAWPALPHPPLLSDKDAAAPPLAAFDTPFEWSAA